MDRLRQLGGILGSAVLLGLVLAVLLRGCVEVGRAVHVSWTPKKSMGLRGARAAEPAGDPRTTARAGDAATTGLAVLVVLAARPAA